MLSRLYERDYERKSLALLYVLAGFKGTIAAYRSTEVVPEACVRSEKKGANVIVEITSIGIETVL